MSRCWPRAWAASLTSSQTAATACSSTAATAPTWPASSTASAQEPGLLERLQEGITAPRRFADHVDELEAYYRGERPRRDHTGVAPVSLRWQGDHGSTQSLAGVNRGVCDRLAEMDGIALERVSRTGAGGGPALPLPAQVEVRHQFPPDLRPPASGRLAVIQPWEFGAAPVEWVEGINRNVDELWVPSAHVRDTYVGSGVDPERVAVIPNGVDLELFSPDGPRMELDAPGVRAALRRRTDRPQGPRSPDRRVPATPSRAATT